MQVVKPYILADFVANFFMLKRPTRNYYMSKKRPKRSRNTAQKTHALTTKVVLRPGGGAPIMQSGYPTRKAAGLLQPLPSANRPAASLSGPTRVLRQIDIYDGYTRRLKTRAYPWGAVLLPRERSENACNAT